MKKEISLIIAIFTLLFSAISIADVEESSYNEYCLEKGGMVESMYAEFATAKGMQRGVRKDFCTFERDNGFIAIGLESFATNSPNIAATMVQKLPPLTNDSPLWQGNYANPSLNVCTNLHGTSISLNVMSGGFTSRLGQADICVFGDGSMVSAWSLIYMANGREGYDDVKNNVRSEPLAINIGG